MKHVYNSESKSSLAGWLIFHENSVIFGWLQFHQSREKLVNLLQYCILVGKVINSHAKNLKEHHQMLHIV